MIEGIIAVVCVVVLFAVGYALGFRHAVRISARITLRCQYDAWGEGYWLGVAEQWSQNFDGGRARINPYGIGESGTDRP